VRHAPAETLEVRRVRGGGKTVVYSGDTSAAPEIMVPVAKGADLLIHDAFSDPSFARLKEHRTQSLRARLRGTIEPSELDARVEELSPRRERFASIHGVARDVGALATAAGCRRLALTSIGAYEDLEVLEAAVREGYFGPLVTASDGLLIEV
jgi:ribonuclease BN (tRNA processing enzyme)